MRKSLWMISLLMFQLFSYAQDTTTKELFVSGNIGVTNNGISIIPTFSLKQPAFNLSYSLSRGGRFSIDPDLRLTFDGKKGGGILWFRYKLKKEGNFKLNGAVSYITNLPDASGVGTYLQGRIYIDDLGFLKVKI